MFPILYPPEEKEFKTNGIGTLSDCLSGIVTEERNGIYEVTFTYPITGIHYSDIQEGCLICVKHDDRGDLQPFEIYSRTAPMNGIVKFFAHHISYRLGKKILRPFTATSCAQAMSLMAVNTVGGSEFTYWTDKDVNNAFALKIPTNAKEILGGVQGSILDVYGKGEYEFDKFTVKLYVNRGADRGVEIRYGKNLRDIVQDTDASETYNAVAPYWMPIGETGDAVAEPVMLPEIVVMANESPMLSVPLTTHTGEALTDHNGNDLDGTYREIKAVSLDVSESFDSEPTEEQLRNKALQHLANNTPWIPDENIEVDFIALWQTEDYKTIAPLQRVSLCDKVSIYYPDMGVNAVKMQVIKVEYDFLMERFNRMELGKAKTSFASVVAASAAEEIYRHVPTTSVLQSAVENATKLITGGKGGYVVINQNADGKPNEILIMDTDDIQTAVNVWRFNANGWGYSRTGYNGTYTTAATLDGGFVADFITTGILNANLLRTGIITDALGKNYWNLETGEFSISLDPGEEGEVTQADLRRVENNAQTYAQNALTGAKGYTDDKLQGYDDSTAVSGKINASAQGLRTEFSDTFALKGDTVTQTQKYYYKSTSPTQLFGGEWMLTNPGWEDGYYLWERTRYIKADGTYADADPVCITGNTGAGTPGQDGADAYYLYVTTDKSTSTPKETPVTVTFTAHVQKGEEADIDPDGFRLKYAWYQIRDNGATEYVKSGKTLTLTINDSLCTDRAMVWFALAEDETFFHLTDASGNSLEDHNTNPLEVA